MEDDQIVSNYVEKILSDSGCTGELLQAVVANIVFSLKKTIVLSKNIEKQIIEKQFVVGENQLIALGVKIEMINTEIESIRQKYLP